MARQLASVVALLIAPAALAQNPRPRRSTGSLSHDATGLAPQRLRFGHVRKHLRTPRSGGIAHFCNARNNNTVVPSTRESVSSDWAVAVGMGLRNSRAGTLEGDLLRRSLTTWMAPRHSWLTVLVLTQCGATPVVHHANTTVHWRCKPDWPRKLDYNYPVLMELLRVDRPTDADLDPERDPILPGACRVAARLVRDASASRLLPQGRCGYDAAAGQPSRLPRHFCAA